MRKWVRKAPKSPAQVIQVANVVNPKFQEVRVPSDNEGGWVATTKVARQFRGLDWRRLSELSFWDMIIVFGQVAGNWSSRYWFLDEVFL